MAVLRAVLLDTHAWAWSLTDDRRLSGDARAAMTGAERVWISPISFLEIGQKVRIGKWPEMAPHLHRLIDLLEEQGAAAADLEPAICLDAAGLAWAHRDPFDRIIAATALRRDLPLVSADTAFDGLVKRIW